MAFVKVLLVIIEVIVGLLLVGIVLLQKSKDEGLGLAFGSGMGESLFGAQAATVLTKITVGLAVVFMVNTLVLDRLYSAGRAQASLMERAPMAAPAEAAMPIEAMDGQPLSVGDGGMMVAPAAPAAPVQPVDEGAADGIPEAPLAPVSIPEP